MYFHIYLLQSSTEADSCKRSQKVNGTISTLRLHTLPHFHLEPINLVVYKGSYILGNLILRGASRLDAFSAYPLRT